MEKGTSSRASSRSSYEVFLSFRGADTRLGFTDCLYHGMIGAGIHVFRDSESLHVGEEIGATLLQAIENSKLYVPIFSMNYASSHWCLRELASMVEYTSKSNGNKEILPIFLDVEPENVKLKTNLYRQALSEHQGMFCIEEMSWEKALIEVGKTKGWNLKKDEGHGDLIQSVVQTVLIKLKVRYMNVPDHLVGVDDRVEAIMKMLDVESNSVQFLGIHGMGGIGKTTLAKVIFNELSSSFHGCSFLSDVRESSQRHGLLYLQKQLLSNFLDSRSIDKIHDLDDGINMIKRVLCNKKVLIVLDDVDETEQLKSLAGKGSWFGSGSRIIITTRNQQVLAIDGEAIGEGLVKMPANVLAYEVQEMEFDHALKLFCKHAFRRDSPPHHYVSLSEKVVSTLGKLPISLEVIGSSLSGKSEALWVDTWKKLQKAPPMEVQKTLMITYERLDESQKQVFLDIACFFVNEEKTYPFYMWDECGYCPHDAIEVLFLMSLVKVKDDNTFWMHDQVRDLGREIVRQENFKDRCECSRVWDHEDALNILNQKEGSRNIEALSLGYRRDIVTRDVLANLPYLRFFRIGGGHLIGDFSNLLFRLRWLSWHYCPPEFMATNFHPTNLVVLDLSCSNISEEWIGWNQIRAASKLKVLDLSYCVFLIRTPDLSTLVSLDRLILQGCCRLIEIDPSIGKLKFLTALNLKGCESLQELPKEIGYLQVLTKFVIPRPRNLSNSSKIGKLPYSIGGRLDLSRGEQIKEIPDSIGKLQSLVELDLSWTSIGHLPDSISNLNQLKVLRMRCIQGITKLPSAIWLLEKLEVLDAKGCGNLTGEIPEEIGRLSCLRILDLSWTKISALPTTVIYLSSLQKLNLESCLELKQLPELPQSLTCLVWTHNSTFGSPASFYYTRMSYELETVTALPTSVGTLSQLETRILSSKNLQFLPQLPSSIRELKLENLVIGQPLGCSDLKILSTLASNKDRNPELSGIYGAEFEKVYMLGYTRRRLNAVFELKMKRLASLMLFSCEFFPFELNLSHMKNLQEVDLYRCDKLVMICGLEELESLSSLMVRNCRSIEWMSDLSRLRKLRSLEVGGCPRLRTVDGLNHLESLKRLWIHDCGQLDSLADTSNLDLDCSQIVRCGRLPDRRNCCKLGRGCYCETLFELL